ncbi:MAG: hypothetical protein RIA63_09370 [Cyclobacteriaceae bacterium]
MNDACTVFDNTVANTTPPLMKNYVLVRGDTNLGCVVITRT